MKGKGSLKKKGIALGLCIALLGTGIFTSSFTNPAVAQANDMNEYNGELDSTTGVVLDGQKWRLTSQKDDNLEVAEDAQRGKVLAITRAADGATGVYDWGTRLISYPALGIEVQPGKTYKLTYDYKLVGEACSTIPSVGILMEDGTTQEISIAGYQDAGRNSDETQAAWKRAEAQYTVAEGVKAIDVRLVVAGYKNEKLFFDNFSLIEVDDSVNLIPSGDMEALTCKKWTIGPGWKQDNAQDQLDVIDFEGRGKVLKYTRGPKNWAGAAGRYEGARLISGNIKVEPNATYVLSTQYFEQMAAGNDAALSWVMYYSPVGGSSTTIGSFNDASRNSGNWETANLEFTVGSGTTEIVLEFEFYGYHKDYVLFDNLSLTKKGTSANLMNKYDAENYTPEQLDVEWRVEDNSSRNDTMDVTTDSTNGKVLTVTRVGQGSGGSCLATEPFIAINVEGGQPYTFQAAYKGTGNDISWYLDYAYRKQDGTIGVESCSSQTGYIDITEKWQTKKITFTPASDVTQIEIRLRYFGQPGAVLSFDNFSLKKGDGSAPKDKLRNEQLTGVEGLHIPRWTYAGTVSVNESSYNELVLEPGAILTSEIYAVTAGERYKYELNANGGKWTVRFNTEDEITLSGSGYLMIPEGVTTLQSIYQAESSKATISKAKMIFASTTASPLYNKKILFIGDEFAAQMTDEAETVNMMIVTDKSLQGTGFTSNLQNRIETQIEENKGQAYDYLFVSGGVYDIKAGVSVGTVTGNDVLSGQYDKSTFAGALEYAFMQMALEFDLTKIAYVFPENVEGVAKETVQSYCRVAKQAAGKWKIPFIDRGDSSLPENSEDIYIWNEIAQQLELLQTFDSTDIPGFASEEVWKERINTIVGKGITPATNVAALQNLKGKLQNENMPQLEEQIKGYLKEYDAYRPKMLGATIAQDDANRIQFVAESQEKQLPQSVSVKKMGMLMLPKEVVDGGETLEIGGQYVTNIETEYYRNKELYRSDLKGKYCDPVKTYVAASYIIYEVDGQEYTLYSTNDYENQYGETTAKNGVVTKSVYEIAKTIAEQIVQTGSEEIRWGTIGGEENAPLIKEAQEDDTTVTCYDVFRFVSSNYALLEE